MKFSVEYDNEHLFVCGDYDILREALLRVWQWETARFFDISLSCEGAALLKFQGNIAGVIRYDSHQDIYHIIDID